MKAKQLESESIIQSYHVFSMTAATKDVDVRLENILTSIQLDTEGKLVQSLSSKSIFKVFEPTFTSFLNEWIENSKGCHSSESLCHFSELSLTSLSQSGTYTERLSKLPFPFLTRLRVSCTLYSRSRNRWSHSQHLTIADSMIVRECHLKLWQHFLTTNR